MVKTRPGGLLRPKSLVARGWQPANPENGTSGRRSHARQVRDDTLAEPLVHFPHARWAALLQYIAVSSSPDHEFNYGRAYRRVFIVAAIVAVGLTVWFLLPPAPVDLRFLSKLHPIRSKGPGSQVELTFKQELADVEKELDAHLNQSTSWTKLGRYSSFVDYQFRGRRELRLAVSIDFSAAAIRSATSHAVPSKRGTTIEVYDPTGIAILP